MRLAAITTLATLGLMVAEAGGAGAAPRCEPEGRWEVRWKQRGRGLPIRSLREPVVVVTYGRDDGALNTSTLELFTYVPALPAFIPPASHCALPYAVQQAHGLVWVRLAAVKVFGTASSCGSAFTDTSPRA